MPPKKKVARKGSAARKPAKKAAKKTVRVKKVAPPPPTIQGVVQLIAKKPGFLDALVADMNATLDKAHLALPPAERESLQKMLNETYTLTGAEVLKIFGSLREIRVPSPPLPWHWPIEEKPAEVS